MPKKLIIDCDPGIDDAVALCLALFDPRLEVVAVTAVEGNVKAQQASLNVQALIDHLDPPRYPRLGLPRRPTLEHPRICGGCTATTAWPTSTCPWHNCITSTPPRRSSATKFVRRPSRSRSSAWAP